MPRGSRKPYTKPVLIDRGDAGRFASPWDVSSCDGSRCESRSYAESRWCWCRRCKVAGCELRENRRGSRLCKVHEPQEGEGWDSGKETGRASGTARGRSGRGRTGGRGAERRGQCAPRDPGQTDRSASTRRSDIYARNAQRSTRSDQRSSAERSPRLFAASQALARAFPSPKTTSGGPSAAERNASSSSVAWFCRCGCGQIADPATGYAPKHPRPGVVGCAEPGCVLALGHRTLCMVPPKMYRRSRAVSYKSVRWVMVWGRPPEGWKPEVEVLGADRLR